MFFFSYKDCSSISHHFDKYQDLPTVGASDVQQFKIDGSLFLAFANSYSNVRGSYNTDSFIYKLNDSIGKFALYQTIGTSGASTFEHFTIADKHYLAVSFRRSDMTYRLNSVIYQWNGDRFVIFQSIRTNGATSFTFFNIMEEKFLAVTNSNNGYSNSINSVIYKWNNSQFESFQEIGTEGAQGSTAFSINNETFIAFANYKNQQQGFSVQSTVFKWSGQHFFKQQTLQTYGATDVKSFNIDGHTFLAFANSKNARKNNIDSFIYKWDSSTFVLVQSIPTREAQSWHTFVMCGQMFLGVANKRNDDGKGFNSLSVVYRASEEHFIKYQGISTSGARSMTSFEYKGHTYLVVANFRNNDGKYHINSTLHKWT